jgi:prolyl-tRNA editing enzyme YbaK/EbsC (Cys-tRNA(Pro) deacylase)
MARPREKLTRHRDNTDRIPMSKSVARVRRALAEAGLDIEPVEIGDATTAQMAADLVGCDVAQIAKSIMFRDEAQTGFAIGGVSPVGHLTPPRAFFDPYLLEFPEVWAAAGTPRHLFGIAPRTLLEISGAEVAEFTG